MQQTFCKHAGCKAISVEHGRCLFCGGDGCATQTFSKHGADIQQSSGRRFQVCGHFAMRCALLVAPTSVHVHLLACRRQSRKRTRDFNGSGQPALSSRCRIEKAPCRTESDVRCVMSCGAPVARACRKRQHATSDEKRASFPCRPCRAPDNGSQRNSIHLHRRSECARASRLRFGRGGQPFHRER